MQYFIALALCLFPLTAAAQSTHGEYYDYLGKVRVNPAPDNYLYISVPGNFLVSHGCPYNSANSTGPFWARSALPIENEVTKAHLQIAMASYLSRGQIYVQTRGCTDRNYPIFNALQLEQN
ncbi:MAG: hypothetical protein AAFW64_01750 [Pseudomonadota bacterium]